MSNRENDPERAPYISLIHNISCVKQKDVARPDPMSVLLLLVLSALALPYWSLLHIFFSDFFNIKMLAIFISLFAS